METVHSLRIDHGTVQTANMSYSQRQPPNHRFVLSDRAMGLKLEPNHAQQTDLYKPSRSPISSNASRYPYPASPQLQPPPPQSQRYNVAPSSYASYRQPRISLLHPEYGPRSREMLQPQQQHHQHQQQQQQHVDQTAGQQPFKKIRLQDKEIQPLRIDTREQQGAYNPQVEAISPTLPDHVQQEDLAFRTTKDELLQQIGKVDREIAKAESQISILKKKQQELEEVASKPAVKAEIEEDCQPKHQSLAQKIYAENRKRAQNAHAQLDALGGKVVDWPMYNQPSDCAGYQENKRKYLMFKKRLLEYFKKRHAEKDARNAYLTETYSKMMQEWLRKVDKIEGSTKRKAKEAKNREFFEKVFPELRKQREDKERFNRVGARIKSEADMEEIMDNLQEQAMEDKKMRSYAVIPPILLDAKERKITYQNNNGHIVDMEAVYKSRQFLNVWTASEKEVFKEKYLQHPKNFGVIASYLDRKSVSDCVQYYYLSKKTENYKQLLRKSRQRTRSSRNNPQKVNSSANASIVDILTTGVTTRLQREQQAKTVGQAKNAAAATTTTTTNPSSSTQQDSGGENPASTSPKSTAINTTTTTSAGINHTTPVSSPTSASSPPSISTTTTSTTSLTAVTTVSNASSPPAVEKTTAENGDVKQPEQNSPDERVKEKTDTNGNETPEQPPVNVEQAAKKEEPPLSNADNASSDQTTGGAAVVENKKKKDRRKDKENAGVETTDDEANDVQDKTAQGQCIVCCAQLGPQLQSRPLAASQAGQYGLREDQVPANGRVCNTCRCKCVRSRYTHCPLPSCPNARGRVKRLRSLPQRLQDLPNEVREPILAEFHITGNLNKCCSACFSRIQRRLGPVEEWADDEVNRLRAVLTELGANWQVIGERLNKPAYVVRSYYAANRKRLNLESCLGDRKPTLTDEEESGSSTSSCEEPMRERHSSDTASAESPPVVQEQPQNPVKKEDYDSSATETADEGQTPDHYQGSATITPVNTDGQPRQNSSPLTVKDLMLNVIEFSLMKTPGGQQNAHPPTSGTAPTISSILNSNDSNEVTIVSEYNLGNQAVRGQRNDLNLAKLGPLIGATITPVPPQQPQPPPPAQEPPGREDLIVMQVPDGPENLTLDLSIKKPRELPPPPPHPKLQQITHRSEAYQYHQERKSPAVYVATVPRVVNKMPSPKLANPKTGGSITLGTPINQPRYEGLLRQMVPESPQQQQQPKMGSITQGTPMHVSHLQDKRMYDYYNKRGAVVAPPPPQVVVQQQQQQNAPPQQPPGGGVVGGGYPYRPPSFEQLSSRQIIMTDYITSQQMLGRRNEKPQYYPPSSPHRTPPPVQQQQQQQQQGNAQQRQGVIQRHTRPQHYPPPPGHEALNSLVDVAVQQPSLPVPSAHEGLGKTMADNLLEQPRRFQIIQQQQQQHMRQAQQQRLEVERRAYHHQQQQQHQHQVRAQQPRSESSTLTAASLIDAIITHQINQAADGNRGEVVANNREPQRASDRLFQSFHREQPDNNGEISPSVINVDLDSSDSNSKNLTVKDLAETVIAHDFATRAPPSQTFYHLQDAAEWKRRLTQQQQVQQQHKEEAKRAVTPQQDERQIIRIAQPQQQPKYQVEPVSPPENHHHWDQNFRRYQQPQSHMSPLDYVKNRIVEVMRTEDDKKEQQQQHDNADGKERSDSPGEMVIDEEKHEEFQQQQQNYTYPPFVQQQQQQHKEAQQQQQNAGGVQERNNEPKPLLSAQYESLSDED